MTDEELKYLRALKPEIDKAMGPWEVGDRGYDTYAEWEGILIEIIYPDNPKEPWCVFSWPAGIHSTIKECKAENKLRIPHPMPMPGVPEERTLWGMIDWRFHYLDDEGDNGSIRITGDDFVTIGRPYLALLKVLAHQWKIEVKG